MLHTYVNTVEKLADRQQETILLIRKPLSGKQYAYHAECSMETPLSKAVAVPEEEIKNGGERTMNECDQGAAVKPMWKQWNMECATAGRPD